MRPILQMNLKVLNCHLRSGSIQLPRTIDAPDAREVHVFHSFRRIFNIGDGRVSRGAYGRVLHHRLEAVGGPGFAECVEAG